MKIAIHQPVGFNEAGGRSNNEDSIFPMSGTATTADRLFLVCDGVGGEHKGEIASSMACQCLVRYFLEYKESKVTIEFIQAALEYTRNAFEELEKTDTGTHGMATTLTLLHLTDSGAILAHLGDSRIYQVRNGKIIFKTKDHKWVNELVESGLITEEQARAHPKRNVITKVISAGRNDQPEFKLIQDVKAGDYFFMCTDGVLEQLYDELLEYHLRDNPDNLLSPDEILAAIKEECEGKTHDNFSAYLIPVETVNSGSGNTVIKSEKIIRTVVTALPVSEATNATVKEGKSKGIVYTIALLVAIVVFAGLAFYFKAKPEQSEARQKVMPDSVIAQDKIEKTPKAEDQPVVVEPVVQDIKKEQPKSQPKTDKVQTVKVTKTVPKTDSAKTAKPKTVLAVKKDSVGDDFKSPFDTGAKEQPPVLEPKNPVIKSPTPVLRKKETPALPEKENPDIPDN